MRVYGSGISNGGSSYPIRHPIPRGCATKFEQDQRVAGGVTLRNGATLVHKERWFFCGTQSATPSMTQRGGETGKVPRDKNAKRLNGLGGNRGAAGLDRDFPAADARG